MKFSEVAKRPTNLLGANKAELDFWYTRAVLLLAREQIGQDNISIGMTSRPAQGGRIVTARKDKYSPKHDILVPYEFAVAFKEIENATGQYPTLEEIKNRLELGNP